MRYCSRRVIIREVPTPPSDAGTPAALTEETMQEWLHKLLLRMRERALDALRSLTKCLSMAIFYEKA